MIDVLFTFKAFTKLQILGNTEATHEYPSYLIYELFRNVKYA